MEQSTSVVNVVKINVVLTTDATMNSKFRVGIGKEKTTGLYDSGASQSCINYDCFMTMIPQTPWCKASLFL